MKGIPYLAAVGALMYLATSTRPDIAYTVGCLARFSSNPGIVHWHAVKHLLHYLKGTADYSITYAPDPIQRTVSLLSSQSLAHIFCTVKQVYSTLSSHSVAQRAVTVNSATSPKIV
jgi:hypothetical protein